MIIKTLLALLFPILLFAQSFDIYTGTYTGSGGDDSTIVVTDLTAAGKHALVIVKGDLTQHGVWKSSAHTGEVSSHFYNVADAATDVIQSFSATGFVIGTDAKVNSITETYFYVALVADSSLLYCKQYTGTGSAHDEYMYVSNIGMAWVKGKSTQTGRWYTANMSSSCMQFSGNLVSDNITGVDGDSVSLGTNVNVNAAATDYYMVAFANLSLLATFTYSGNDADSRDIPFGSTLTNADMVFVGKQANNTANCFTTGANGADETLNVNAVAINTDRLQSFTNSTVNLGANGQVNASLSTYFGFALGDYTAPATATGKFKGNSAYNKFKGW